MGNQWGLGLQFIIVTIIMVATINTCLGARNINITVACFEHERLALLKFKHSVRDDNGMLSSWVGNDCCRWERVMCDGVTGHVDSLHLSCGLVSKELSTSLGELRHLKYLDLSWNHFQGSRIPEFIGSLKQLTYLNLSNADFSGIIPHQIGKLSNLKILDLSSNAYILDLSSNGYIENLLIAHDVNWISGLSSLEHLDLSSVNLTGAKILDVVLYMAPSVKVLSLSFCGLLIDDRGLFGNLSTTLSNIKHLDLRDNIFTGKLPHFFQNMTSLQFLDLSYSRLATSNFANLLSMIPSLLELHLLSCILKETHLSHILHNLTTLSNLQHLDLSHNGLTGSIPESFSKLKMLHVLDLSYNDLTGPIPTFHGELTELYLSGNELNGSIPETIGRLAALTTFSVDLNELSGTIPVSIGQLSRLQFLDVSSNQLIGSIPVSIGQLSELSTLDVSWNRLIGSIPVSIGQLSKLGFLDVSYNYLEGLIYESHFANLSMLEDLNTAYNAKLAFNVSREWLPPFQLIRIDLGSCKIENGFPQWLRNQRKLHRLLLSNTTISGPLPTWLRKMPIIPLMDISHNNLSGPLTNLPNGVANVDDDEDYYEPALYLQNNTFNELIPRSLCKRTDLVYLDLSNNRLTGEIPKCFKNLQNLRFLRLSSNGLSGIIPSFIGLFPRLISLSLNDNNFSGELPATFWNLSWLWVLDLGDNALCGKIPESIGEKMKSLLVFRLHNNNFTGGIPQSLCANTNLQILDVARNNLTGTIPHCLGELQGMVINHTFFTIGEGTEERLIQVIKGVSLEYTNTWSIVTNMDLSSNKLVGDIPVLL